ncbi:MAG: hypothetical protein ACJ8KX_12645 [Chthoniobacterales bacterium]
MSALSVQLAKACDVCGCYMPDPGALSPTMSPNGGAQASWITNAYFAIAEQFTHFGTLQFAGDEVANPTGQYLDSSITQLVAGYNFTSRFALQLNVPLIYRSFERPEGFTIDRGSESGLGDVSLLANVLVYAHQWGGRRGVDFSDPKTPIVVTHDFGSAVAISLVGGLKFPTGGTSRLKEEFNEIAIPGAPESGIHGHDLTLGSGSFDGIFGLQTSLRHQRFFFDAAVQYTLRSEGAHQYEFADDVTWDGGPGVYLIQNERAKVGLQFVVSGEHKGHDEFRGERAEDTAITTVAVGPRVVASLGRLNGELGVELPVSIDNSALQVVPDYRIRAAVSVRF